MSQSLSGDGVAALLAADDTRLGALVSNDIAVLTKLLHPQLVYVHTNGGRDTRESLLAKLQQGTLLYRTVEHGARDGLVTATTGIVYGSLTFDVLLAGDARTLDIRYQSAWTTNDGQWQMVGWLSCLR